MDTRSRRLGSSVVAACALQDIARHDECPELPHPLRRLLLTLMMLSVFNGYAVSAPTSPPEGELKAGLVLNFARYVEWPERSFTSVDAPVVICLLGDDRYAAAFGALGKRKLQSRPVQVRRSVRVDDLRGCHVAFMPRSEERRLLPALRSLGGLPVLTISDAEGFIDLGGAIGIVQGEQRLQFEVNRGALEQARLKASSQLLKLARSVLKAAAAN